MGQLTHNSSLNNYTKDGKYYHLIVCSLVHASRGAGATESRREPPSLGGQVHLTDAVWDTAILPSTPSLSRLVQSARYSLPKRREGSSKIVFVKKQLFLELFKVFSQVVFFRQ